MKLPPGKVHDLLASAFFLMLYVYVEPCLKLVLLPNMMCCIGCVY